VFKKVLLCFLISSGIQMVWAHDNLSEASRPSELDLALIKKGILDKNYKIINPSKIYEELNNLTPKRDIVPNSDAFKVLAYFRGLFQEINFNITLLKAQSNKDLESPTNKYVDMFTDLLFPLYCYQLSQNIFTRVNPSTMNVSLMAKDGSFIGQVKKNNSDCNWEQYNYIDLSSQRLNQHVKTSPRYIIAPQIPSFNSYELDWGNRELEIELLVNENGDVIKVGFPSIYFSDESDKVYQKLKPAFLKAKFYPYIEDGRARSFLILQPVELRSSESEPLFHKITKSIFGKK
jgi:hypothetical protein|tara:strand:+ start:1097 stop:1966 length:870 start_codon:yes stop_codon:yes gene_type:complete